ncbi:MAG: bifunctional phosphoserine phosphatase/homoserine phosphotransferase ThrH [Candidatus Aenigmatarchaeota archaeon]
MPVVCLDMEGVLMPEIWKRISEETGIGELKLTTRDVSDYNELMEYRLKHLKENGIKINDIKSIAAEVEPLEGAEEFLDWLKKRANVSILTGSFYSFLLPLIRDLRWSPVIAKGLEQDEDGYVVDYYPKNRDMKVEAVKTLRDNGMRMAAIGDSFNDARMLKEVEKGILFRPSEKVSEQLSEFPVVDTYQDLKKELEPFLEKA